MRDQTVDVIELIGRINQQGQLEVDLPAGLPPGEVRIRIMRSDEPLTGEDATALMETDPATGADIVAEGLPGGWRDLGIEDGQAWVDGLRQKRKARRAW